MVCLTRALLSSSPFRNDNSSRFSNASPMAMVSKFEAFFFSWYDLSFAKKYARSFGSRGVVLFLPKYSARHFQMLEQNAHFETFVNVRVKQTITIIHHRFISFSFSFFFFFSATNFANSMAC